MKVSLIQLKYEGSKEKTVKKTVEMIQKSKGELVILPELHEREYFCKNEDTKYFDYAESFEEDVKFWAEVSKKENRVIIASLFEKVMDGIYYNTAVVLDKGRVAGKYRKTHIPDDPGFYEKFYFTPGDEIEPIDISIGVVFCFCKCSIKISCSRFNTGLHNRQILIRKCHITDYIYVFFLN